MFGFGHKHESAPRKLSAKAVEDLSVEELRIELERLNHDIGVYEAPPASPSAPVSPPQNDGSAIERMRERRTQIIDRLQN